MTKAQKPNKGVFYQKYKKMFIDHTKKFTEKKPL